MRPALLSAVLLLPAARGRLVPGRPLRAERGSRYFGPYTVHNFTQRVDHYNADRPGSFQQRYLVNDTGFRPGIDPIFFFTGAEGGDVRGTFWDFESVFDYCRSLSGLCVFAEHRFFGSSVPYSAPGGATRRRGPGGVGLLSPWQALADAAALIRHLRDRYGAWQSPLLTFGGSLAGLLAALMRILHPGLVDAAIASSAPAQGWVGLADQFAWRRQVTANFAELAADCPAIVRRGFLALRQQTASAGGAGALRGSYRLCELPPDAAAAGAELEDIAEGRLEGAALSRYPPQYEQVSPLCARMRNASARGADSILPALINTPDGFCLNLTQRREDEGSELNRGWYYLSCTAVMHPIGSNNVTDMFPPENYSAAAMRQWCAGLFGSGTEQRPRQLPERASLYRLGRMASRSSRILYSYGSLDPWARLGMPDPPQPPAGGEPPWVVQRIPGATHCSDLAGGDPGDTAAMRQARAEQRRIIGPWLQQAAAARSRRAVPL